MSNELCSGWFERQRQSVHDEVAGWPEWMRRAGGIEQDTLLEAASRYARHKELLAELGIKDHREGFAYQLVTSPYYDEDWEGVDGRRLEEDTVRLAEAFIRSLDE